MVSVECLFPTPVVSSVNTGRYVLDLCTNMGSGTEPGFNKHEPNIWTTHVSGFETPESEAAGINVSNCPSVHRTLGLSLKLRELRPWHLGQQAVQAGPSSFLVLEQLCLPGMSRTLHPLHFKVSGFGGGLDSASKVLKDNHLAVALILACIGGSLEKGLKIRFRLHLCRF